MRCLMSLCVLVFCVFMNIFSQPLISLSVDDLIYDDFLVNEDLSRGIYQYEPAIAVDEAGNYVIVWEDYRNSNTDIYFQYFNSSGEKVGDNQKVNNSPGMFDHRSPEVAMDANGDFIVVWQDNREGDFRIYFQRYGPNGEKIGGNRMVEMDVYDELIGDVDFAMMDNGGFVFVWRDYRSGDKGVYFQRYDESANPLGSNQLVSLAADNPAVDVDSAGRFVVSWEDSGAESIFFKRYDATGGALCEKTVVDSSLISYFSYSDVAVYDNGNYIISWSDVGNGGKDVYINMYDSLGNAMEKNILVNDSIDSVNQLRPRVDIQPNGNFIAVWMDNRNEDFGVRFQRFNALGEKIGSNQNAIDDTTGASQGIPDMGVDGKGNFVLAWQDDRNDMDDIYYQRFDSSGNAIEGFNQQAENDQGCSSQEVPSLAVNNEGEFVVSWFQRFGADNRVYCQKYNPDGSPLGGNTYVNHTSQIGIVITPHFSATAMNDQGKYVVLWESDIEPHRDDIMFQLYDSDGTPIGENQVANGAEDVYDNFNPQAAMWENGDFIIIWFCISSDFGEYDLCFQKFDETGNRVGEVQVVNKGEDQSRLYKPDICMTDDGRFIITWPENRDNSEIKFQIYDSSATAIGGNQKVMMDDNAECRPAYPNIACANDGRFAIAWHDNRDDDYDVYFQVFDETGTPLGENGKANDDYDNQKQLFPTLTMNSAGDFIIAWNDYRFGDKNPDLVGQKVAADGTLLGGNVRLVESGPNFGEKSPTLCSNDDGIYLTWQDNRRSKNWDIYAKAFIWDWSGLTGIENNKNDHSKISLQLINYPNPFNENTNIEICSKMNTQAQLEIYDLLGRRIWKKDYFLKGNQRVKVNLSTRKWPAGVYFHRLKTSDGRERIKRALLLK